jgi:hypothetical protein
MSTSSHHERNRPVPGATDAEPAVEVSRRSMLAGAVATVAAIGSSDIPAYAHTANPNSPEDMMAFLLLSEALTGIRVDNLAPEVTLNSNEPLKSDPGVDPINVKDDYFNWVNASQAVTFERLLQIAKDNSKSATDIITKVNATDDTKYLARSIVLMWYLGSWYRPEDLKDAADRFKSGTFIGSEVISAKAYTQGRVWQIAAAHPMGYSNLQFGYWSREPDDPKVTDSPLEFIATKFP